MIFTERNNSSRLGRKRAITTTVIRVLMVVLVVLFLIEYIYLAQKNAYDISFGILSSAPQSLADSETILQEQQDYLARIGLILIIKVVVVLFSGSFAIYRMVSGNFIEIVRETERLSDITANIPGGVICCGNDEALTVKYISDGFSEITGYTAEDIELNFNNSFLEMIFPSDRENVKKAFRSPQEKCLAVQFRMIKSDGTTIWLLDKSRLRKELGNDTYHHVLTDITDMKNSEIALIKSQAELKLVNERYRIVLEQSDYIVFDLDLISNNITYSGNYEVKFGNPPSTKNFPKCFIEDDMVHFDDIRRFEAFFDKIRDGASNRDEEVRIRSRSGSYLWYNICATTIVDDKGTPIRVIGRITDITRQRSETIKIVAKSQLDESTGLLSFDTANEYISGIIDNNRNSSHGMIIVDFSVQSDDADDITSRFAANLRDLFRSTDIVGRVDSTKFIVFMRNCSKPLLKRRIEDLLEMINSHYNGQYTCVGAAGAALYPSDSMHREDLFQKAQIALTHSMNKKTSGYTLYEEI